MWLTIFCSFTSCFYVWFLYNYIIIITKQFIDELSSENYNIYYNFTGWFCCTIGNGRWWKDRAMTVLMWLSPAPAILRQSQRQVSGHVNEVLSLIGCFLLWWYMITTIFTWYLLLWGFCSGFDFFPFVDTIFHFYLLGCVIRSQCILIAKLFFRWNILLQVCCNY